MKLEKAVQNVSTVTELKRVASAYVIDYRNLTDDEIKEALIKTAPQYYYQKNLEKSLSVLFISSERDTRTLSYLILKNVILHKDDFMCPKRELENDIVSWEQSVVDRSNEDLFKKGGAKKHNIEMLQFVIETAWENNNAISSDEQNLIEKLKNRLRISDTEYRILEAKIGKFPKPENQLHSRGEIDDVRRQLQSNGILFPIRNEDGTDFDVVPEEIATVLRKLLNLEIRSHGYEELIGSKYVRSKSYLVETLGKCDVEIDGTNTVEALQSLAMEHIQPSVLLGGLSPRDGLPVETLAKWCSDLHLNVSGTKPERIDRIIAFYDNLFEKDEDLSDEREIWYKYYVEFASRNVDFLRRQQLIEKDIETERKFEDATDYLFEKILKHKPLAQVGTNHCDGALTFRDELIYWDNKSKESPVHLKDHLRQFDSYIKTAEKRVFGFLVIGPSFTEESSMLAMHYQVENGTTITLITAEELKKVSEVWEEKLVKTKSQDPFPLGYIVQQGRFNPSLLAAAL
jgi:hypothetical protein